jgi:hypothetical protein
MAEGSKFLERISFQGLKNMKFMPILAGLALSLMPAYLAAQSTESSTFDPPAAQSYPSAPHESNNAWDHGEIQVFGDYFRFTQVSPTINFVGVGARAGFNVNPFLALEANMSYDFAQNYTSHSGSGASTSFSRTSLRPITGLFGPKFQFGSSSPVRAFLTGKVGFVNFSTGSSAISSSAFTGAVNNLTGSGTRFAMYPGAGVEFFGGPIGFRIDVGELLYMDNGLNNDLKISGGPAIRF